MSDNYLEHKQHKYIKKIGTGKNARYFYTQAELAAYNAMSSVGKGALSVGGKMLGKNPNKALVKIGKGAVAVTKKVTGNKRPTKLDSRDIKESKRISSRDSRVIKKYAANKAAKGNKKRATSEAARWAINSAKKPKAMPTAKAVQAGRNASYHVGKAIKGAKNTIKKEVSSFKKKGAKKYASSRAKSAAKTAIKSVKKTQAYKKASKFINRVIFG